MSEIAGYAISPEIARKLMLVLRQYDSEGGFIGAYEARTADLVNEQFVRVDSGVAIYVDPRNGQSYYEAKVVQWNDSIGDWNELGNVWAIEVGGTLDSGAIFYARQVWNRYTLIPPPDPLPTPSPAPAYVMHSVFVKIGGGGSGTVTEFILCGTVSTNANYWNGVLKKWNSMDEVWSGTTEVWLRGANGKELFNGNYYISRKFDVFTIGGIDRVVWMADDLAANLCNQPTKSIEVVRGITCVTNPDGSKTQVVTAETIKIPDYSGCP